MQCTPEKKQNSFSWLAEIERSRTDTIKKVFLFLIIKLRQILLKNIYMIEFLFSGTIKTHTPLLRKH